MAFWYCILSPRTSNCFHLSRLTSFTLFRLPFRSFKFVVRPSTLHYLRSTPHHQSLSWCCALPPTPLSCASQQQIYLKSKCPPTAIVRSSSFMAPLVASSPLQWPPSSTRHGNRPIIDDDSVGFFYYLVNNYPVGWSGCLFDGQLGVCVFGCW